MKLNLTEETRAQLTEYLARSEFSEVKRSASHTALANLMIAEFVRTATASQTKAIAQQLLTPKQRLQALIYRAKSLSCMEDQQSIKVLERAIARAERKSNFSKKKEGKAHADLGTAASTANDSA